jgi:hypothetical protein
MTPTPPIQFPAVPQFHAITACRLQLIANQHSAASIHGEDIGASATDAAALIAQP